MQPGSSNLATEATLASKNSPFYWPTDGNINVPGNLYVTGTETVEGRLTALDGAVVDVGIEVNGPGSFVNPAAQPLGTGAISTAYPAGNSEIGLIISNDPAHGDAASIQGYVLPAGGPIAEYALDLNPQGGDIGLGGNVYAAQNVSITGTLDVAQVARSATGFSAVTGNATQFATMNSTTGDIACDGDFHVFPTGSGPLQPPGTEVHRLDSTPGSTNNYIAIGGNSTVGIGKRNPAQKLDVSGNVQVDGGIFCNGIIKAQQQQAWGVGLIAGGDTVIPSGTSVSPLIAIPGVLDLMTAGAYIQCTYKNPSGIAGAADNGGGAITACPQGGCFQVVTQNAVSANTTITYVVFRVA